MRAHSASAQRGEESGSASSEPKRALLIEASMPFIIKGVVVKGLGLGKKFHLPPTMNLRVKKMSKKLKYGVYAAVVKTPVGIFNGVAHYGPRPAVSAPVSFEIHCFGLKKNLYGQRVSVALKKRIREVKNFPSIAALKKAIRKDVLMAKKMLKLSAS